MEFTFGIITDGNNKDEFINKIIESIFKQNIPHYEIIIVGQCHINNNDMITIISFDETIKPAWITRKKNIICQQAKYENIVLMHDYIVLHDDWYQGYLKYGNDFLITSNKILNGNKTRYIDYSLFPHNLSIYLDKCLLPYDIKPDMVLNKFRFFGGYYYVIKKSLALQYLLDETRSWGQGEDVDLCVRLSNDNILLDFNPLSTVQFLKYKNPVYWVHELSHDEYEHVKTLLLDKNTYRFTIEGIVPKN
ncbi:MAG TPA: glycosyltransferase family A protein [Candidatus Saccharimonadales bacterium]|nr:glycosyltransferase family A protein [Candidatus Saccharimonadales bacterium]